MAKNLTKHMKQPMAMEMGAVDMEKMAASENLAMKPMAADMVQMNNMKRKKMHHMGDMPMPGDGSF